MDILENQLIRAVLMKDRDKTKELSESIFNKIAEDHTSFDFFKNYLIQFNGIFYWNTIKNIKDIEYTNTILHERNVFLLKISESEDIKSLKAIFFEMLDFYTASQNKLIYNCSNPLIKTILIFIYNNCGKKITLEILSNKFHISKSYLSNLISKHVGHSLPTILLNFRLEKAILLLLDSNLSINEISHLVGFDSTSYFCHQFKSEYGITPKQFRSEGNFSI